MSLFHNDIILYLCKHFILNWFIFLWFCHPDVPWGIFFIPCVCSIYQVAHVLASYVSTWMVFYSLLAKMFYHVISFCSAMYFIVVPSIWCNTLSVFCYGQSFFFYMFDLWFSGHMDGIWPLMKKVIKASASASVMWRTILPF